MAKKNTVVSMTDLSAIAEVAAERLANSEVANETPVEETQPVVETAISEQQEAVLATEVDSVIHDAVVNAQELQIDTDSVDETLVSDTDQSKSSFEMVSEIWEAGQNDDTWLLEQVSNGMITSDQFNEIRGLTVEEAEAEVKKPIEPVAPLLSLESAKEKILSMIKESNGVTKAAGALAVVTGWSQRNEINKETYDALVAVLTELGLSDGSIGGNNPPNPLQELMGELEFYKPSHATLDEAKKDGENAIGLYIRENIKLEGTLVSRLIGVFSDIAYHAFKNKDLELTVSGDADVSKGKPYMGVTHRALWSYIKKHNMLGEVKENTVKIGDRVQSLGKTYDPYSDPSIAPIAMDLCKRAICYAFGHKTGVVFGFMPKRSANGRPSIKDVFELSVDDPEKYLRNLCIPAKMVRPLKDQQTIFNRVGNDITDIHLEGGVENDDESFVWFSNSLLEPVYQWLHGHELEYYTIDKGNTGFPDGSIKGSHDPRFAPGAQQRESSTKLLEKATTELAATKTSLEAALKGIEKEDRVGTLQAMAAYAENKNMPVAENEMYQAFALALAYLNRLTNGKKPSEAEMKAVLRLKHVVDLVIDEKDKDHPMFISKDGLRTPIAA